MQVSHVFQTASVRFDDQRVVANAGVGLVAQLIDRIGLVAAADAAVTRGFRPGRKVASVVCGMALGADSIDDLGVLRAGATERVLNFKAMAPETLGQWLRSFSWGHVGQLDVLLEKSLAAAWSLGAGPGLGRSVIDLDSSVCGVYGDTKQGAAQAYNHVYGYHPLLATLESSGEMLGARMRGGDASSARGAVSFAAEIIERVRRCGAHGELVVRADSAFYNTRLVAKCRKLDTRFSIGARMTKLVRESIEAIDSRSWQGISYPRGVAQVAEIYLPAPWSCRLIVRRYKNPQVGGQGQLFDQWGYASFITDQAGDVIELDAAHRRRARQELAIKDLKDGALAHLPSASFNANAAWLSLACIAHNLLRCIHRVALRQTSLLVTQTMRYRLLSIPARITRSARKVTVHLPARWPYQADFLAAVRRLRIPAPQPM